MRSDWVDTTLQEVAVFGTGHRNSQDAVEEGPYPFFTCSREILRHSEFDFDCEAVIMAGNNANARFHVQYYKGKFAARQRTYIITPIHHNIDGRYLYYVIQGLQPFFEAQSQGTTTKFVTIGILRNAPITLPPLGEQQAISSLLGSLDDKIELNRRMNETLESMARAIFKDWFVDFGPTRAKAEGRAPYLAAELWDLFPAALNDEDKPVGWEEVALKELGEVVTGKTPSTKRPEYYGDEMPFLKIPDMHGNMYVLKTSTALSGEGAKSQAKKTLAAGSISVSCIATPGLVVLNHRETQTNQQINSLVPSVPEQSLFAFWSCRQLAAEVMLGGSGGSVFHNMNKSSFENLKLIFPGNNLVRVFSSIVQPLHDRILASENESEALARTRDLLLPKLMYGEIRLREAEKTVEAVA